MAAQRVGGHGTAERWLDKAASQGPTYFQSQRPKASWPMGAGLKTCPVCVGTVFGFLAWYWDAFGLVGGQT